MYQLTSAIQGWFLLWPQSCSDRKIHRMCFAIADSLTVLILTYCSTTLLHFYTALAAIPEFHIFKKMYTDSQIDSKVTKRILYTKKKNHLCSPLQVGGRKCVVRGWVKLDRIRQHPASCLYSSREAGSKVCSPLGFWWFVTSEKLQSKILYQPKCSHYVPMYHLVIQASPHLRFVIKCDQCCYLWFALRQWGVAGDQMFRKTLSLWEGYVLNRGYITAVYL